MNRIGGKAGPRVGAGVAAALFGLLVSACGGGEPEAGEALRSSRSYEGHAPNPDADRLVSGYPSLVGTRLDDCQTCHSGKTEDGKLAGNACDQCHDLLLHGDERDPRATLNPFGRSYLEAGRSPEALLRIKGMDSDGDGFTNDEELSAGRYPGNPLSLPGQEAARIVTVTGEALRALPFHTQLSFVNATRQQFDDYVSFRGVRVEDLLEAYGIDLTGATGITLIAPDGYRRSLPIEYVTKAFPPPLFFRSLDRESLGPSCGFVRYPRRIPAGLSDGAPIPGEHRLLLAYQRDDAPLDPAALDVEGGGIRGEGPFRIVVPQDRPGKPDRGSAFSPSGCEDGFDYREDADHNAGAMVRGVIAIRVDPMPEGLEEFDYWNGGWAYAEAGRILIYGHGIG
jgi:hypothetical protein